MTRFLLIRHGESEWNVLDRWQGSADVPLSDHGREQAELASRALDGFAGPVVSSPLVRARETAEIIASAAGLGPVAIEADLREIDVGELAGLTSIEAEERFGAELARWRAGELHRLPGGEDRRDFGARVLGALKRLAVEHDDAEVLVVTHGGVISRLERDRGVHPGRGAGNLSGRWFGIEGGELQVLTDRVFLLPGAGEPAPEAR